MNYSLVPLGWLPGPYLDLVLLTYMHWTLIDIFARCFVCVASFSDRGEWVRVLGTPNLRQVLTFASH